MKKDKKILEENFSKDILTGFKKINIGEINNIYVTSNLNQISKIRISKQRKLDILLGNLKKTLKKNYTIFSPTSNLDLFNKKYIFDLKKTPSFNMGPLAEYIRTQKNSVRSMHPFWSVSGFGKNAGYLKKVSRHAYGYGSPWSKMLDLDFQQLNLGIHPSKAVTLIHHIETIYGVPYRFNKQFKCSVLKGNKIKKEKFYVSVFFRNQNIKKRFKLNEHFFLKLKKNKKLKYFKTKHGLEMWSFKMRDFFEIAINYFNENIFNYLEFEPDLNFQKNL
ncbi:MAG: hypothetical protein CMG39_00010 [Candidatus Marinimicrobia bacterium]|nr:hypothetical protein [Candidatus Neomarinimicrobiota bacterium]